MSRRQTNKIHDPVHAARHTQQSVTWRKVTNNRMRCGANNLCVQLLSIQPHRCNRCFTTYIRPIYQIITGMAYGAQLHMHIIHERMLADMRLRLARGNCISSGVLSGVFISIISETLYLFDLHKLAEATHPLYMLRNRVLFYFQKCTHQHSLQ